MPSNNQVDSANGGGQFLVVPKTDVGDQYDRIGLLYDVTKVFAKHGLTIDLAMITTEAYRVVDVFYVTDSDNNKLDDPSAIDRLREELLEVISR